MNMLLDVSHLNEAVSGILPVSHNSRYLPAIQMRMPYVPRRAI